MIVALLAPFALAAGPDCAETIRLTASTGTVALSEKTYDNGMRRCWQINAGLRDGQRLRLQAVRIDVEAGYDFVEIYTARGALLDGDAREGLSFYDREGLSVRFTSDESGTDRGFELRWSVEAEPRADGEGTVAFRTEEGTAPGEIAISLDLGDDISETLLKCDFSLDGRYWDRADVEGELAWMTAKCPAG